MTDKIINSFYKVCNVILEIKAAEGLRDEIREISEKEPSNPCESAQSAASAFYSSG